MEKITAKNQLGIEYVFEVVDKIPEGFMVWNVNDMLGDNGYVPLCEWKYPDEVAKGRKNYDIRTDTLKTIKIDPKEARILKNATAHGVGNLENAKKVVAKGNPDKNGWFVNTKWDLATKALPIFEKIS